MQRGTLHEGKFKIDMLRLHQYRKHEEVYSSVYFKEANILQEFRSRFLEASNVVVFFEL